MNYNEILKETQDIFCDGVSELLTKHCNYIHETFKDRKKANKYIRENGLNTLDKLPDLYNYINMPFMDNGAIIVEIKEEFKAKNFLIKNE